MPSKPDHLNPDYLYQCWWGMWRVTHLCKPASVPLEKHAGFNILFWFLKKPSPKRQYEFGNIYLGWIQGSSIFNVSTIEKKNNSYIWVEISLRGSFRVQMGSPYATKVSWFLSQSCKDTKKFLGILLWEKVNETETRMNSTSTKRDSGSNLTDRQFKMMTNNVVD